MFRMKYMPRIAWLVTLLLTVGPVLAQNASKAPAPKETMAQPWASIVAAFFLMILIAVPSFLSAKRGHQD